MPSVQDKAEQIALTVQAVAQRYSVSTTTVHKWARTGAMPHARRIGGALRWLVADLQEWECSDFSKRLLESHTE